MRKQILGSSLAGMLLVSGGILLAPKPAPALVRADDAKTYTLERTFKKDNKDRYNIVLKAKGNNPQFGGDFVLTMDMTVRETTKDIKEGVAEIGSEFENAQISVGGLEQEVSSQFPKSTYKADKTGRVWDIKTEGGAPELQTSGGNEQMISVIRSSFYPPKPIKVGDSWDIVVTDAVKKTKDGKPVTLAKGKATVTGTEKIANFDALNIKTTLDILIDEKSKTPSKFEGNGSLDVATGKLLKIKGTLDGNFGPLGNAKADLTLSLMTGEAKQDAKAKEKKKDG